jgi:hypothetical protein
VVGRTEVIDGGAAQPEPRVCGAGYGAGARCQHLVAASSGYRSRIPAIGSPRGARDIGTGASRLRAPPAHRAHDLPVTGSVTENSFRVQE